MNYMYTWRGSYYHICIQQCTDSVNNQWGDTPDHRLTQDTSLEPLEKLWPAEGWTLRTQTLINSLCGARRWNLISFLQGRTSGKTAVALSFILSRLLPSLSRSCSIMSVLCLSWWKTIICIHFLPPLFPFSSCGSTLGCSVGWWGTWTSKISKHAAASNC